MKDSIEKNTGVVVIALLILVAVVGCIFGFTHIFREHSRNKALKAISQHAETEVFRKGVVSEEGYESEYLNLRYSAPEGFRMCDETEIQETFAENAKHVEMGTVSTKNGESIYIFAEDLPEPNAKIDACVSAVKSKIEARGPVYVEDGNPYLMLGREFEVMLFSETSGKKEIVTEVLVRKQKAKMVYMVLTYPAGKRSEIEKAMDAFGYY